MLVELEKLREVQELTLGSLRPQVAGRVTAGANAGLEHKVECHWRFRLHTGVGVLEVVLLDELAQLFAVVVVNLLGLVYTKKSMLGNALSQGSPHIPEQQHRPT